MANPINTRIYSDGAVKPDALTNDAYEYLIHAHRMTEIPRAMKERMDYDVRTDTNPVYLGYAPQGLSESSTNWLLKKITYDGSDRITLIEIAFNSWDNRASAF